MKNKFKGYYKPLPEDLANIWNECTFVFDTNVLFDFFRYSTDTVELLFNIFEKLQDRIWIPHRVGLEYHRGLEDRIKEQVDKYSSAISDLTNFSNKIKSQRDHPFLSAEFSTEIQNFSDKFNAELTSQKSKIKCLITENPIKERMASLIGDNIGDPLTKEEEEEIITNGDKRLSNKIPPGYVDYKDKEKRPGLDKYGDYIIWEQILKAARIKKKPFVLVTFDKKEDWYKLIKFNSSQVIVGPRPELVEEFLIASECSLWLYPTPEFIDYAIEYLQIEIDANKLTKIKQETTMLTAESDNSSLSDVKNENESMESNESVSIGETSKNNSDSENSSSN